MDFRPGWCHCIAIHRRLAFLNIAERQQAGFLSPFTPAVHKWTFQRDTPLDFDGGNIVNLIKLLNKDSHMHHCHFANIFGKNSLVCSIHFLPVPFLAAETIWCVVIKACGGIFPQLQQDSLASETTYSSLVKKKKEKRTKLFFTETQSSVKLCSYFKK